MTDTGADLAAGAPWTSLWQVEAGGRGDTGQQERGCRHRLKAAGHSITRAPYCGIPFFCSPSGLLLAEKPQ